MKRCLLVLAACGDNLTVPIDAAVAPDAAIHCAAAFSGNFVETSAADACAVVSRDAAGRVTLALAVPTTTLAPSLMVTIDLGPAPLAGFDSSETTATWAARGARLVGTGACIYAAGSMAVPHGSFALTLTSIDTAVGSAHGDLQLALFVLSSSATDCGSDDTERLDLAF